MSGQNRPSTGLRDHKIPKPRLSGKILQLYRVKAVSLWKVSSQGSTAASGRQLAGSAADTEAPEFEYEQGCLKGMQANPTEGFHGGDDAGTETAHAHSHLRTCACTHPLHALTNGHTCARIPVCTDAHANTQRYMHAHLYILTYVYTHASMHEPQHARKCTRTCTHSRMNTTISKHAHTHT